MKIHIYLPIILFMAILPQKTKGSPLRRQQDHDVGKFREIDFTEKILLSRNNEIHGGYGELEDHNTT